MNPVESYAHSEFPKGTSITALAKAAGVTYGTVHKTIQGLYSAIPKSLVEYLSRNSELSIPLWQNLYGLWVREQLIELKKDIEEGRMDAVTLFLPVGSLPTSFSEWRKSLSYSQIDFCKTFLLHQTIINNYELGKMKSLPASLVERLRFLGMSDDYIKAVGELK